jgi:hypothetical protein
MGREIHSFQTSTLGGGKCLTSRPGRFTSEKELRYPLNSRLDGPHSQYGRFRKEENFPLAEFQPRTAEPVA